MKVILFLLATLAAAPAMRAEAEALPVGPTRILLKPDGLNIELAGDYWFARPQLGESRIRSWPVQTAEFGKPLWNQTESQPSLSVLQTGELVLHRWNQQPRFLDVISLETGALTETHMERTGFSASHLTDLATPSAFWTLTSNHGRDEPPVTTVSRLDRTSGEIESFIVAAELGGDSAIDTGGKLIAGLTSESTAEHGTLHYICGIDTASRQLIFKRLEPTLEELSTPVVRNGVIAVGNRRLGYPLNRIEKEIIFLSGDGSIRAVHPLPPESEFEHTSYMFPTNEGFWIAYYGPSGCKVSHFKLGGEQLFEIDYVGELPNVEANPVAGISDRYFAFRFHQGTGIALFERKAPPILSIQPARAHENEGRLAITITIEPPSDEVVRCRLKSFGGSAKAGEDYMPIDETIVFPPGTTRQTSDLTLLADNLPELHETIDLRLLDCEGAAPEHRPPAAVIEASGVVSRPLLALSNIPSGYSVADSPSRTEFPIFSCGEFHLSIIRSLSTSVREIAIFNGRDNGFQAILESPNDSIGLAEWWYDDTTISSFSTNGLYVSWSRSTGELIEEVKWPNLPAGDHPFPNLIVPTEQEAVFLLGNPSEGVIEINALTGAKRTLIPADLFSETPGKIGSHSIHTSPLGAADGTYWTLAWMKPDEPTEQALAELQLRSYDATTLELLNKRVVHTSEIEYASGNPRNPPYFAVTSGPGHVIVDDRCFDGRTLEPIWSLAELQYRMTEHAGFAIFYPKLSKLGHYFIASGSSQFPDPRAPVFLLDPDTMTIIQSLDPSLSLIDSASNRGFRTFPTELLWKTWTYRGPGISGLEQVHQISVDRRFPEAVVSASRTIAPHGLTLTWSTRESFDTPFELTWRILETEDASFFYPQGNQTPQVPEYFQVPVGSSPIDSEFGTINLGMIPNSRNWPDDFELELEWSLTSAVQSSRPSILSSPVVEPGGGVGRLTFSHHPFYPWNTIQGIEVGDQWLAVMFPNFSQEGEIVGRVDIYDRATATFVRSITRPPAGIWSGFGRLAKIQGDRILIASPSYGEFGEADNKAGEVFLFDIPSGNLLHTFTNTLRVAGYGFALATNETYFCIGAPGIDPDPTRLVSSERGGFEVFNWSDLKSVWKKTTAGEMLGSSLAFRGDDLFVGAPYASPRIGLQKAYYVGAVHRFEIARKALRETITAPAPEYLDRFGQHLQIAGGRLMTKPKFFYQFDDQTWYQIAAINEELPFLDTPPILNRQRLVSEHSGKIEILDFETGRLHFGGPDDGHSYVRLTDDDWLYWSDGTSAHGMPLTMIEGFFSWSTMLGKDLDDFDEYLEETGARFSLQIDPSADSPLPLGLMPEVAVPNDAEAVIEKSLDLKHWMPAYRLNDAGQWVPLSADSAPPSEFFRLKVERHPAFEPLANP